ncbi:MAG: SDR family NAD(P)-dependent oxidoreductase [Candidatus Micrarchaeota archaeon]
MANIFEGKTILVTGGTGSVGREIVKELLPMNPKAIRVLDIDETREFEMAHAFRKLDEGNRVRYLIGDVRDKDRMKRAFEGVDIVFHCAAMKHVLACEYNSFEAVKTNVVGLQNVLDTALDANVEKFVFTSSDKAAHPSNVMGTTKLLGEKLVTAANYYKGSRRCVFASVRFGNVFGSRGSVVPLFKKQIAKGGPVTITDTKMTRFVMTLKHTLKLLFKATEIAQGGEVFVLKMPVLRIDDLADVMISEIAGKFAHKPAEIKKKIIGAIPGEKMYEELMTEEEALSALEANEMFILIPPALKDLFSIDTTRYSNTKPAKHANYRSSDEKMMTMDEIKKLLVETGFLK